MGMEIHLTHEATLNGAQFEKKEVEILDRLEREGGMVRFDSKVNPFSMKHFFEEMGNMKGYSAHELAWCSENATIKPYSNNVAYMCHNRIVLKTLKNGSIMRTHTTLIPL